MDKKNTNKIVPEKTIDAKEVAKKLAQQNKKLIKTEPIPNELASTCKNVIAGLENLKSEISKKQNEVIKQNEYLESQTKKITKLSKVQIDKKQQEQAQQGIKMYTSALDNAKKEIDNEIKYLQELIDSKKEFLIVVNKDDPQNFLEYFPKKLNHAKRYAKNIKKDLAVSFSRYTFSFERQKKQLDYLESVLKLQKK